MADMTRSPSSVGTPDRRGGSINANKGATSVLHKLKIAFKKKPEDADAEFEAARANFLTCKTALEGLVKDVQAYVDAAKVFVDAGARVSSGFAAYFGSLYDAREVPKNDRSLMIMASQSDMIHQKIAEDHHKIVSIMDGRFFQKVQKPLEQIRIVSADVLRRDTLRKENMYYGEKVSKLQEKASHGKEAKKDTERRERNEKHLERTASEFAETDGQALTALRQIFDGRFTSVGPFLTGFLEAERTLVSALYESVVAVDSSYKQAQIAQKMPAESTPGKPNKLPESISRSTELSRSCSDTDSLSENAEASCSDSKSNVLSCPPPSAALGASTSSLSITVNTGSSQSNSITKAPPKNPFDMDELEDSPVSSVSPAPRNPFAETHNSGVSHKPPPPPPITPAKMQPGKASNPFDDLDAEASKNPFSDDD